MELFHQALLKKKNLPLFENISDVLFFLFLHLCFCCYRCLRERQKQRKQKQPPFLRVLRVLGLLQFLQLLCHKKLFYYDFLIFPSNESLRVTTIYTAFSDRQHQICQRSTHAMGGITWHSHPNSHRNTAKR